MAAVMATMTPDGKLVAHAESHAGVVGQLVAGAVRGRPSSRRAGPRMRPWRPGRSRPPSTPPADHDPTRPGARRGLARYRGSPGPGFRRHRGRRRAWLLVRAAAGVTRPARTPLPITKISATSWTRTTAASPSTPKAASGIRMAISPRERPTFCSMIDLARRAWVRVCGRWRRSSPMRATSAVSMATSLPIAPIAIPTSAVARAGASLTPSPTIAVGALLAKPADDGRTCPRGGARRGRR